MTRRFKRGFFDWNILRLRLLFIVDGRLMDWFTRVNTRLKLDVNQWLRLTLGSTLEGLVLSLEPFILCLELVKLWIDRAYSIVRLCVQFCGRWILKSQLLFLIGRWAWDGLAVWQTIDGGRVVRWGEHVWMARVDSREVDFVKGRV